MENLKGFRGGGGDRGLPEVGAEGGDSHGLIIGVK